VKLHFHGGPKLASGDQFGCQNWSGGPVLAVDQFFRYTPQAGICCVPDNNDFILAGYTTRDNSQHDMARSDHDYSHLSSNSHVLTKKFRV